MKAPGHKRKPLFAANWKMHKLVAETDAFVLSLGQLLRDMPETLGEAYDVLLCPPATHLSKMGDLLSDGAILLGAQNCGTTRFGAFTGETSPAVLKELGCTVTLVGHSERRHIFKESDELVLERSRAALAEGLQVMLCVGEQLEDRRAGRTNQILERQLSILEKIEPDLLDRFTVAYEPVWAIGTGENATPAQAAEAHAFIREWSAGAVSADFAAALRILYGGSVKPENAGELMRSPEVDGFLVGGASLDPVAFSNIVRNGLKSRAGENK